jgi:tetratricopeptide (TPR) repeat protein
MIRSASALLVIVFVSGLGFAQTQDTTPPPSDPKAGAYYHFAMGHVYAELSQAYGNKPEYLNKAIQHYKDALKLDPAAGMVFEELTDLYIQTNRLRDAIAQAEELLKLDPNQIEAHRMLSRIYMRMVSSQDNRINEEYLKKAIEELRVVTGKDAKDAESWLSLGRLYRVSNNSVEAEKAFNQALTADPDNEEALTGLAMLYGDLGDNRGAIEKLKQATDKNPNERTLIALGTAYEQARDYKNAAAALRRALAIVPDNPRLQAGLANDLMLSDQVDEALRIFEHLAQEDPANPSPKLRIAEIYRVKRDFAKAAEALKKAKALSTQDIEIRYEEVRLLEAQNKYAEAIALMKALVDDTARPKYSANESAARAQLLAELASLYRLNAQYTESIDAFRKASAINKDNAPDYSLQIIDTYRTARNNEGVRREVEAASADLRSRMKGKPDLENLLKLASVYEKGRIFAEEAKVLDEAERTATSPKEKETVCFMRGAMFERQKRIEAAETEFRKVLASNPEHSGALNYLGYMLVDHNVRVEEATALIKKALDSDPENGAYLDSLGWAYFQQGKLEEAEGLLIRAIDRVGEDPTVHDHLGDIYFKLGKIKEAITQWQASLKGFRTPAGVDSDPDDVAKVSKKLDAARVKLAKEMK